MEIFSKPPLPMPLLTIARQQGSTDLSFLKPGQLLSAQVVSPAPDGNLSIKINDRVLKVVSDLQLVQGTQINVKVEIKEGQLVLRLITPQDKTLESAQQALRQVLPKQQPMQPLFTQLARIAVQAGEGQQATRRGKAAGTTLPAHAQQATTQAAGRTTTASTVSTHPLLTSDKTSLTSSSTAALPPLPPKVRQAIASLIKQLPSNEKLTTPEGLRQAVNNSGMFFENHLQQGSDKASLQGDLKTILFRIAFLLRQSLDSLPPLATRTPTTPHGEGKGVQQHPSHPPGTKASQQAGTTAKQAETTSLLQLLSRQNESALARVQMNQLTTLNTQQRGEEPVITLELPLFNGKESEVLGLKIQRESKHNGDENEVRWSVTLKLDSEEYGAIRTVVSLVGQKVSTTFWCEQPETQQRFQQHLEELRSRMQEQGLELGRTQAFTGIPAEPDGPDTPRPNDNLINIQA